MSGHPLSMHVLGLCFVLALSAIVLQGCGGGGSPTPAPVVTTTTTTTTRTTTVTVTHTTVPSPPPPPSIRPMLGISYGALPCSLPEPCDPSTLPPADMMQAGYKMQWGPSSSAHRGRNDLGAMKALGANTVRLYHSLGYVQDQKAEAADTDHGAFLDHAHNLGMHVLPGFHSDPPCPNFDCYDLWKANTLKGFKQGFAKNGKWHPAVAIVILLNEPDFFGGTPNCVPKGAAWCRVKAVLSALDGVLAGEKEANVTQWGVNFTATWSFAEMTSIDGKVTGPGIFGFQDMVASISKPSIAKYSPRTPQAEMERAFLTRWTHGLNVQAPYDYVQTTISAGYAKNSNFGGHPWFIGEDGELWQTHDKIFKAGVDSKRDAEAGGYFMGMSFFQFQTAVWKGGTELNFGVFGLGSQIIGKTPKLNGKERSVYCLNSSLTHDGGLNSQNDHRALPLAEAWGGSLKHIHGLCNVTDAVDDKRPVVI